MKLFFMLSNSRSPFKLNCNLKVVAIPHRSIDNQRTILKRLTKDQKHTTQKWSCLNSIEENALFHRSEKTENQFWRAHWEKKKVFVFKHGYSKSFLLQSKHMWLKVHSFDGGAQNSSKCQHPLTWRSSPGWRISPHVWILPPRQNTLWPWSCTHRYLDPTCASRRIRSQSASLQKAKNDRKHMFIQNPSI